MLHMFMRKDLKSESEVSFFVIQPGFLVHNPPGWEDVWSACAKRANPGGSIQARGMEP